MCTMCSNGRDQSGTPKQLRNTRWSFLIGFRIFVQYYMWLFCVRWRRPADALLLLRILHSFFLFFLSYFYSTFVPKFALATLPKLETSAIDLKLKFNTMCRIVSIRGRLFFRQRCPVSMFSMQQHCPGCIDALF